MPQGAAARVVEKEGGNHGKEGKRATRVRAGVWVLWTQGGVDTG